MTTPQSPAMVEVDRIEFFEKESGEIRTNHEYFVLRGEVWRENYNTYESQPAVIGFDDCIVRVPEIGWRIATEAIAAERALSVRLKLEAQAHAQEARAANATIAEIYQLCTGATGEPGNWNGAEPVRAKLAAERAEVVRLREAAIAVLAYREGDLPTRGWLRDNDASRKALSELAAALATPTQGEKS